MFGIHYVAWFLVSLLWEQAEIKSTQYKIQK
jgi:hypothetical protein